MYLLFQVCNGSGDNPYNEPPAPVHIVTGSAVSVHLIPFNMYIVYCAVVVLVDVKIYVITHLSRHALDLDVYCVGNIKNNFG